MKRFKAMTAILGISAFYHDSAAALVVDGEVRAAVQEERLSRQKHDAAFPRRAIQSCLASSGLSGRDIDFVAFYEKPMLKFERLLETSLQYAPRGYGAFCRAMPSWARDKLRVRKLVREALGGEYRRRVLFVEHHESHAASAFYPSPFHEAAVLTVDGVGEWTTATVGIGHGNQIELLQEMRFPHSLGLLYSAFTTYCGFRINDGEYKLMGLAPYGTPRYANLIREHVVEVRDDGSFRLNMELFRFGYSMSTTHSKFHRLFGGAPRKESSPIEQRHADLAASIQVVTEEILVKMARHVRAVTGARKLCLAGGVALNCVANRKLREEAVFEDVWIQPAAGDAGGALGAAMLVWHQLLNQPRPSGARSLSTHTRLGPAFGAGAVAKELTQLELPHERYSNSATLVDRVSDALSAGKVVGWFQGAMEFGPRALGGRSLLADPRDPEMQSRLNLSVKGRESFRPFAPMVSQSSVSRYFDVADSFSSPLMSTTVCVKGGEPCATTPTEESGPVDFAARLAQTRSLIPAVTHVDQSARVQTVCPDDDAKLNQLLHAFEKKTGMPVLINTSFNGKDEPIVCTPRDALRCFLATEIDLLVIEDCVLDRMEISHGRAVLDRLAAQQQQEEPATGLAPKTHWSFAAAIAVMIFVLASRWYAMSDESSWPLFALVLMGCVVLGLPRAWPQGLERLHRLASLIFRPVGWCLSRVALSVIYVGVLIPVAGVMRLGGHDPLGLGRRETKETYWEVRDVRPEVQRYFRQFR